MRRLPKEYRVLVEKTLIVMLRPHANFEKLHTFSMVFCEYANKPEIMPDHESVHFKRVMAYHQNRGAI